MFPPAPFPPLYGGGDNVGERVYTQSMVSSPAREGKERGAIPSVIKCVSVVAYHQRGGVVNGKETLA